MVPPLIERELRVALLRRKVRKDWMKAIWTAGSITFFFMVVVGLAAHRSSGRRLFFFLFTLAIYGIVTRGFSLTADLFSEERRNGTLGLLVLTGLRPLEIFANKLVGALVMTTFGLLGALPFFAMPFLAGGVPAGQFLCALTFLVNGLLFCVSIGLLASVVHREGGQAQVTAQALAAALCLATPLVYWVSSTALFLTRLPAGWLALSPAYPPYLIFTSFAAGSPKLFWLGTAITFSYSLAALILAAVILHRTWREEPQGSGPMVSRWPWRIGRRRGQNWQQRIRRRLLEHEPFCWLAARDRLPGLIAYGILGVTAAIWLAGWAAVGRQWHTPARAFLSSFILHQALNLVGAYAAARRFAEERLSGGFEVLLTSPLSAWEIVEGQCRALLVQFRLAGLLALFFDLIFCGAGFTTLNPDPPAVVAYFLAWALLLAFWFGLHLETTSRAMWISAWTGRPGYAAMKAASSHIWLLLWVYFISRGIFGLPSRGTPASVLLLGLTIFPILYTFGFRRLLRVKLANELRLIACAPIPARGDKRFKKWSPDKIFPPGRWGELVLRPARSRYDR